MRIRYGMLMTDGVGKAGGQSIQRRGTMRVLRNISIPTQRIASTMNPQRFVNSYLFSLWSQLTNNQREEWNIVAAGLTGTNIWGEDKTYSGREAFLMCNGTFYPYNAGLVEAPGFNYIKPTFEVREVILSTGPQTLTFIETFFADVNFYQMKAIRNRSGAVNPKIEKLKTFVRTTDFTDAGQNFEDLEKTVGKVLIHDYFTIAIRGVSTYGLVSPWNIFNVQAI